MLLHYGEQIKDRALQLQEGDDMTTYEIRLTAILDNYKTDQDYLRIKNELHRLEMDITKSLRIDNFDNPELEQLLDLVWEKIDEIPYTQSTALE